MTSFRVLYRQFLFRLADLEALSAHAEGDLQKLFGQFASLLIFISLMLSMVAMAFEAPKETALGFIVASERFLISTTMLVVGLFAVLCWDSTFPDRRDAMVLCALPLRARTIFLAKIAAAGSALLLVVALLHSLAGLAWPLAFALHAQPQTIPAFTFDAAAGPMTVDQVRADLDRAMPPLPPGFGVSVGVVQRGQRRVFAYGAARPDSVFEVGSVTKTFTSLILARMVERGMARLDEPVRALLPPGTLPRGGDEITLLDLATHHSGLSRSTRRYPEPPHTATRDELFRGLTRHGGWKLEGGADFAYSNFGVSILGHALANRAGSDYAALIAEIAAELGLHDTGMLADMEGYAPAGGIRSTASDILTYLEAQMHPDRFPGLAAAIRATHVVRADGPPGARMALGWMWRPDTRTYLHGGAMPGFTTSTFFSPEDDYAAVVLANHGPAVAVAPDLIAERIRQRLTGEPALALGMVDVPASRNYLRWLAAYWATMLAASVFLFACVLAAQGVAAQLLPRRVFLHVSGAMQMAAFCLFVGVYFFEPKMPGFDAFTGAAARARLAIYPSYWFLGMFHQLNGSMHPAFAPLAQRAWIGLGIAISIALAAYAVAYVRTLRAIVEQPDIVPAFRGMRWRRRGHGVRAAIAHFSARSLLRSRQHRMILAFYLGVALALTIWFARTPAVRNTPAESQAIAASLVLLGFWIAGLRVVFALPLEFGANWIFRAVPLRPGPAIHAARRRSLMLLSLWPACAIALPTFLAIWPWRTALAHTAVLALLGVMLAELAAAGPQKIPFACSYLPGKSNVHVKFWLFDLFIFMAVSKIAQWEGRVLASARNTTVLLSALAVSALAVRWTGGRSACAEFAELRFEERPDDAIQKIGLDPGVSRTAGI